MFKSMTAYGRRSSSENGCEITVEVKSVNGKYLDVAPHMARQYAPLENRLKSAISSRGIARGRIDATLNFVRADSGPVTLTLDEGYTRGYIDALRRLRDEYDLPDDITVMSVAANRDIFATRDIGEDLDEVWRMVEPVLAGALDEFVAAREREGEALATDIRGKLGLMRRLAADIKRLSEGDIGAAKERIRSRITAVLADNRITVDESRLLTECAIWADRIAIDEELVRLSSHMDALEEMFSLDIPVGRKFDFQLQEASREINTIGSKCQNTEIANIVVRLKNEAEKIREQIQNIE